MLPDDPVLARLREVSEGHLLLRTREVAYIFDVADRTVTDWVRRGWLRAVRCPGGQLRYRVDEVERCLREAMR